MSPLKSYSDSLLPARAGFTPDLASWKFILISNKPKIQVRMILKDTGSPMCFTF